MEFREVRGGPPVLAREYRSRALMEEAADSHTLAEAAFKGAP